MKTFHFLYRFPGTGKIMEGVSLGRDEVTAWLHVFRRHYLAVELLESRELT